MCGKTRQDTTANLE